MPKVGFSPAAIEETQQLMKKPRAEVEDEKMRWVVSAGHYKVKAAMERHPAMVHETRNDGCLPCNTDTAKNPHTRWWRIGPGAPPPQAVPPRPGKPPAQPDDSERPSNSGTVGVPPGYVYIHTLLRSARYFNPDPYAKVTMRDQGLIPDLLTDEGPFGG